MNGTRLVLLVMATGVFAADDAGKWEYEIGGPLAGVKRPLLKGDNGDIPGHPGSIPDLAAKAEKAAVDAGEESKNLFTPQGQLPMVELYPGSVELFRTRGGRTHSYLFAAGLGIRQG